MISIRKKEILLSFRELPQSKGNIEFSEVRNFKKNSAIGYRI